MKTLFTNYLSIIILAILAALSCQIYAQRVSWEGRGISPHSKVHVLNIMINVIPDKSGNFGHVENTADSVINHLKVKDEGINNFSLADLWNFMDLTYRSGQNIGNMTRRFGESSFDALQITGDFIMVSINESRMPHDTSGNFSYTSVSAKVIELINEKGFKTISGCKDIKKFDMDGDNIIDFTQVSFLNLTSNFGKMTPGNGKGGLYGLSKVYITTESGTYGFYNGTTQCKHGNFSGDYCSIVHHEFSHYLFGGNAFHTSGGNHWKCSEYMPFLCIQHGHGLMGGAGCCLLSCNGYERWRMHWKHPNSVDYISACNASGQSVVSDVTKADGTKTFILRDFVTYGDVVRIKLPYKDSDDASNQYIWLENHQVGKNNKIDWHQYAGSIYTTCRDYGTPGIYAYYQVGRDILEGDFDQVWNSDERDNLKMISAEGYWDFDIIDSTYTNGCVNYEEYNQYHRRSLSNPFNGYHDQEMQYHPKKTNASEINTKHCYPMRLKQIDGVFENNLAWLGDRLDAFSTARKIGMSTNPSTCNAKTFYNCLYYEKGSGSSYRYTEQSYRNNDNTYLSGLSIQMSPIGDGSSWKVVIRWDDYNITTSANWTGRVVLKEKAAVTAGNTITLQQNRTPARATKNNETGYFDQRSSFSCEQGSEFVLKSGSKMTLTDRSNMIVKGGSTLRIENGGVLYIKSGSKLTVESCGFVKIEGNGYIECENGNGLEFLNGAILRADNLNNIMISNDPNIVQALYMSLGIFNTKTISSKIIIDRQFSMSDNLLIKSNGHLIVTSELNISKGCVIRVEPGGKLTVNGGKLTGSCNGGLWKGIEVLGSGNLAQTGNNFGIVTLIDAVIENAEVGVLTAQRTPVTNNQGFEQTETFYNDDGSMPVNNRAVIKSGGRLIAQNSVFRNNIVAVEFTPYTKSNLSELSGCTFQVDSSVDKVSDRMMYINTVGGVLIKGCKFIIDEDYPDLHVKKMKGIKSLNSSYRLYPICVHYQGGLMHTTQWCPTATEENYNKFENLYYGIYATGVGGSPTFGIKNASFTNTRRGIYASGVDNVSITDCKFDIPGYKMSSYPGADEPVYNYGIYCNGSTNYQIEGNSFEGVYGKLISMYIQPWCYGVILNNSGNSANRVYNNSFKNLEVAAQAQGENRNPQTGVGLCFSCNDFEKNKTDIAVTANVAEDANSIAEFQYNKSGRPAANGFSPDSDSNHQWDMFSYENGPLVTYVTFKENADGRKYIMTKYTKATFVNPDMGIDQINKNIFSQGHLKECPRTSYQSGGGVISGSGGLLTLQSSVRSSENSLNNAVEKGGNAQLINQITSATQNDSGQLRTVLSDNSPYLSEEAVIKTIENIEAVNSVMLRDVLVNNSHAIREKAVINSLENRSNSLPDYMNEQILTASNRLSGLDLLKMDLQHNSVEYGSLLNGIIQSYQNTDSLAIVNELIENSIDNNLKSGYALYNATIGNKDKAEELIYNIENSNNGLLELIEVFNDSLYDGNIDSTAINTLKLLSNQENRFGIIANNILNDLGVIEYEEPVYPVDYTNLKTTFQNKEKLTAKEIDYLTIYPNPVKNYLTIEYNGKDLSDNLTLIITKIDGKLIQSLNLEQTINSIEINVSKFEKGSYIISLTSERYIVHSQKFIVE